MSRAIDYESKLSLWALANREYLHAMMDVKSKKEPPTSTILEKSRAEWRTATAELLRAINQYLPTIQDDEELAEMVTNTNNQVLHVQRMVRHHEKELNL